MTCIFAASPQCPGPKPPSPFPRRATADLVAAGSEPIRGTLKLLEEDDGLLIRGEITGLSAGNHGFHIHEVGSTGGNCTAAGPHFNPGNKSHGSPKSENRHAGDLGNVLTPEGGPTHVLIFDKKVTLDPTSKFNILDRSIVVHEKVDDLGLGGNAESVKTGNAGKRLACAVVKISCPVSTKK